MTNDEKDLSGTSLTEGDGVSVSVPADSASHAAPVADCGCVYHAEQGIPCEHDKALAAPHVAPEIVTVEIDPSVWWRGRGPALSRLLRFTDGSRCQCCLGIATSALGVEDAKIVNRAYPIESTHPVLSALLEADRKFLLGDVYEANDHRDALSDDQRIARINAGLEEASVPLRFTLKTTPATTREEASTVVLSASPSVSVAQKAEGR